MNKFKILIFILSSLILLTYCTTTSPQTGSLSGTVNLEGQSDDSSITQIILNA